jgi:hypothetical protein
MKWYCLFALFALAGCGGNASFVGGTGTPVSFTITCPILKPCEAGEQFQVYRIEGQCPSSLAGSSGWITFKPVLASSSGVYFTDSTVISGVTYRYDVEGVLAGASYSGPSNCVTRSVT